MGNSQPQNRVGRKATAQKLENAKKIGVLSLTGHELETVPAQLYSSDLRKLRTLDLSKNKLRSLEGIGCLLELKSLNVEQNDLHAGALSGLESCKKLQTLIASRNQLGVSTEGSSASQPLRLPSSLRSLALASNAFYAVPRDILSSSFSKLERLDLSDNRLASIPPELSLLINLNELVLDGNGIAFLPDEVGRLKKLKVLSLRNNRLTVTSTRFSESNPQPIPKSVFQETVLIDLNLHGNSMTNTQLNEFDGFQEFLDRRQKVKSKTLTNLSVCGLS